MNSSPKSLQIEYYRYTNRVISIKISFVFLVDDIQRGISKPLQEMMVSSGDEDSGYSSNGSHFGASGGHFGRSELHSGSFSSGYGSNRGSHAHDKDDFGDDDDSEDDEEDDEDLK